MSEYYDVVLGLIPLALLGITGGLTIAGVQLTTAVTLAGVVAISLIAHALFVNGPVDPAPATTNTATNTTNAPVDAD